MDKIIGKICRDLIEKSKKDKNVLGIMLFGSVARNKSDEYSDIDFYVLLKKKNEYSRRNFITNDIRVDIIFNTLTEAKTYLKNDEKNVKRITSHMLAHGIIIYQKGGILENLQSVAGKNLELKTKYNASDVLMHKYSIDDFLGEIRRDLKNQDIIAFNLDSQLLMNNIIELFLKIRGNFWKQPNEMTRILKELDLYFGREIGKFYKAKNLKNKEEIMSGLVNYIYKKSGGGLPNKWVIR
ncbi:MAG: nucleotidyltransferase domain-containing protein [Patescibacteria group bacterium]